jgi:hypothetical protein
MRSALTDRIDVQALGNQLQQAFTQLLAIQLYGLGLLRNYDIWHNP